MRTKNYQMILMSWSDINDPVALLQLFLSGSPNNYSNWTSHEYDREFAAAGQSATDAERWTHLQNADAILVDQLPLIPLLPRKPELPRATPPCAAGRTTRSGGICSRVSRWKRQDNGGFYMNTPRPFRISVSVLLLFAFCLLPFLFSGCRKNETPVEAGNREQILHIGNGAEPRDSIPPIANSTTETQILVALYEGLVNYSPDARAILPGAAGRWEVSPTARSIPSTCAQA